MQFTVEPEGKDWVASDGQRRFINYDPVTAVCSDQFTRSRAE